MKQQHHRVLLVEDDSVLGEMYEIRLKAQDYEVLRAINGKQALEEIASFKPDIILLDIMMPEMNGIEVLQYLRAQKETKEIPVFMLTALSQSKDRMASLEAGADDYIVKSETVPREVVAKVDEVLKIAKK